MCACMRARARVCVCVSVCALLARGARWMLHMHEAHAIMLWATRPARLSKSSTVCMFCM